MGPRRDTRQQQGRKSENKAMLCFLFFACGICTQICHGFVCAYFHLLWVCVELSLQDSTSTIRKGHGKKNLITKGLKEREQGDALFSFLHVVYVPTFAMALFELIFTCFRWVLDFFDRILLAPYKKGRRHKGPKARQLIIKGLKEREQGQLCFIF